MRLLARLFLGIAALTLAAACGGGGDDDPQGPGGATNWSALIDGEEWTGLGNAARSAGGIYTITGADASGGAISISLYNIPGPGTYALGMNATGFGGTAIVSEASPISGWATVLNGRAGSVTITTLTDTRIAGTFQYTAAAQNGAATGTRVVTEGEFDMLMLTAGAWSPPDAWDGSRLNGRVGSDTVIGATMAVIYNGDDLVFNAGDLSYLVSFTIQDLTATGALSFHDTAPIRRISLTNPAGSIAYFTDSTSAGNVTVTTFNANRIAGSYTATLKQLGAAGTINVSGTFDVGIPHF